MSTPLWYAQDSLYDLLIADSVLHNFLGNPARIYDFVPENSLFPFIQFGEMEVKMFEANDFIGFEQNIKISVLSRYRGRKEVKDILDRLVELLHHQTLTLTGQSVIDLRIEKIAITHGNDGLTSEGVIELQLFHQPV